MLSVEMSPASRPGQPKQALRRTSSQAPGATPSRRSAQPSPAPPHRSPDTRNCSPHHQGKATPTSTHRVVHRYADRPAAHSHIRTKPRNTRQGQTPEARTKAPRDRPHPHTRQPHRSGQGLPKETRSTAATSSPAAALRPPRLHQRLKLTHIILVHIAVGLRRQDNPISELPAGAVEEHSRRRPPHGAHPGPSSSTPPSSSAR